MNILATIKTAFGALRAHIGRSVLTVLGIVIGIVAIVLVISLGQGARELILNQVESIGANSIIVRPGREPSGPSDVAESILADSLKVRDLAALKNPINVPGVASVEPAMLVPGSISYQDEIYRATVFGWTPTALGEIFDIYPEQGSFFTEDDVREHAKVIVIGSKVKQELFGASDALGTFVTIRGQRMKVVGILPASGQVSLFNVDEVAIIPYTTAQKSLLGVSYFHELFVRTHSDVDVDRVSADIKATLRETHGITDPEKDDFFVVAQKDIVERVSTITRVLTIFLVAMASISLVVGGIGIMNIMLVSVTERTQEIGLRKALGATNRDIVTQFLIEGLMLTTFGGLVGTIIAIVLAAFVSTVAQLRFRLNWLFHLPVFGILLGVGIATAIGLVFGIYPARKAARKDPIEALRFE